MYGRTLLTTVLLLAFCASFADTPRVAIIIDDLGYHLADGKRAIGLPGAVTFSILPGAPRARVLAEHANDKGKQVLLHLPLQAHSGERHNEKSQNELSEIGIDMSRERLRHVLNEALESVPHAAGINSHRGSLMTRHPGHMRWLLEEIGEHDPLFFIDSFTHHESVALQIARETGVDAVKRDVFLDPDRSPETVAREFERMKDLAKRRGRAIAIGHPYPATLDLLERELPLLREQGFELVNVSDLVR